MSVVYVDGNVLELAAKKDYIAHACNAVGHWGAGFAWQLKRKFPKDFEQYKKYCLENKKNFLESKTGTAFVTKNKIACLVTSYGFGKEKDKPEAISTRTFYALEDLRVQLPQNATVYSNKFNSGLFNVPWEKTEAQIKYFLLCRPDVKWIVVNYKG